MFSFAQNEKTRDSGSFCIAIYALYGYNKIDSIPHRRRVCHGSQGYHNLSGIGALPQYLKDGGKPVSVPVSGQQPAEGTGGGDGLPAGAALQGPAQCGADAAGGGVHLGGGAVEAATGGDGGGKRKGAFCRSHRHQRKHLRPSAGRVLAAIHRTASGKEDTDKGVRLQRHV